MNARWRVPLIAILAGVTSARADAPARAPATTPATDSAVHAVTVATSSAKHVRLDTNHGPVHVWTPPGYTPDGAALVVYVHGYYTDVDGAWTNHRLAEQFALSGLDAVFVACEAPKGARDPVRWRSLGDLVTTVVAEAGVARPTGPTIAIGHSGAYRTLIGWLDYPLLDTVVLLDALYGEIEPFRAWALASPRHRLIDVTVDTVRWSEELARDLEAAGVAPVRVERIPIDARWPEEARGARAVLVRSQLAHMPLVTDGVAIPAVLRLLPVPQLPDGPWALDPGDLPGKPVIK